MRRIAGCWMALTMAAVLACGSTNARAQSEAPDMDHWPAKERVFAGATLKIVTEGRPKTQQTCHVLSFGPDRIECTRHAFGSHPKVYLRADVQKIVLKGNHPHTWLAALSLLGVGGGVMTGAVYLAAVSVVAAVPVALVGTVVIFMAVVVGALGDEEVQDQLLYAK